ncbi:MAG: hypothetical protein Q8S19_07875 [Bacillota bacterium]|nr:hypothetical protein [Bacillota bacterium]
MANARVGEVMKVDQFVKRYKEIFKPLATKHGFRIHRQAFFRVINDVAQFFVLRRDGYGRTCTLEWAILPLCMGLKRGSFASGMDVAPFLKKYEWWEYDPGKPEDIEQALTELLTVFKNFLLPIFETSTDSASAYEAECSLDRKMYGEVFMHSSSKTCFTIKMGDYAKAVEHLRAIEEQNLSGHEQKVALMDEERKERYLKRFNEDLAEIRKQIELLSIPDMDYINDFIDTNEEMSLRNLGVKKT